LTEHGFFEVCKVLDQVQGAMPGERQALKMGLQLVIEQDRPSADERARALRASEEIWSAFPPP
jgi:hypothetical protein